jgi:hypothetical protein
MSSDSLWSLFITATIPKAAVGRKHTEEEREWFLIDRSHSWLADAEELLSAIGNGNGAGHQQAVAREALMKPPIRRTQIIAVLDGVSEITYGLKTKGEVRPDPPELDQQDAGCQKNSMLLAGDWLNRVACDSPGVVHGGGDGHLPASGS